MPPHSEVENDPFEQQMEDVRVRQRKRSRSISPGYGMRRLNQGRNSRSSRSSSAASEVREPLPLVQQLAIVRAPARNVSAMPVVVSYHEAPPFLQFNPFIYRGYRTNICTKTCLKRYGNIELVHSTTFALVIRMRVISLSFLFHYTLLRVCQENMRQSPRFESRSPPYKNRKERGSFPLATSRV